MCLFPRPEANARGTAQRSGDEVVAKKGAPLLEVFQRQGHIINRIEFQVLVVGDDEDEVGLVCGR